MSQSVEGETLRHRGNRKMVPEHRDDSTEILVPEVLLALEVEILEHAATVAIETPDTPSFYGYSLAKALLKPGSTKTGAIYKAIKRLEGWSYLTSTMTMADTGESGRKMQQRICTITQPGWDRLKPVE